MIRSKAFEQVKNALRKKYKAALFISDLPFSDSNATFPAVSIVESNNTVSSNYSTFGEIENVVSCDYDVNVYANDEIKKDEQALEIMNFICDEFKNAGYYRTYENQITNLLDASITRRNAKFKKNNITEEKG